MANGGRWVSEQMGRFEEEVSRRSLGLAAVTGLGRRELHDALGIGSQVALFYFL